MYRIEPIIKSWLALNAWRQNYDPTGAQLKPELTTGESRLYYQDEHPMLTLDNLKSIMPDFTIVKYPDWAAGTAYPTGAIVQHAGQDYEAQAATTAGQEPGIAGAWEVFNPFNNWLKQKTEAGIVDTVVNYLEKKELNLEAKALLENRTIFDGIGNIKDKIPNRQRRAGFEIVTSRTRGLTARLDRVGLQLAAAGEVIIYLHHSSRETPLEALILSYTKPNSIEWFDLAWELPNVSDQTDAGGAFYVTYNQSALPGEAIRKERTWNEAPCESCATKSEFNTWKLYSAFIELHPFTVPEPEVPSENLWDITDNRYEYDNNFGINFAVSIYCDYTEFFVQQRDLFKSALRKQVAINLLRELVYNPSSRITQGTGSVSREQLLYEIDGDTRGRNTGMLSKYTQAIEAIVLNTRGLNRICLPCGKKGVKYRSI